jgi:hypothetical protein
MAGNTMTLEFAGDAKKLQQAAKESDKALGMVGDAATSASKDFDKAASGSDNYLDKVGKLGAGVEGISGAFDNAGSAVQALADFQSQGVEKAAQLARASNDVKQATEDMSQAQRDAKQSTIDSAQAEVDLEQARLDQTTALKDYTDAVKKHGKNSAEARQAQIDLKQAGVDVTQAQEDARQATRDLSQANIDAEAAQLDLNDAQREAHPPEIQQWADKVNMITPLLSGMTAVVGLVTVAQWAWNASLLASPVTWIVLAIAAVIAIVVLLVKHWDWVKKVGAAAWGGIKTAAANTWDFMKKIPGWLGTAFKGIANVLTWPFRTAFNFIADAWNHTIGSLHWSVPGWIPGIGGNSIAVPNIPRFHSGGTVPGAAGSEMLAVLQAGETVTPAAGGGMTHIVVQIGRDTLLDIIAKGRRSGGPAFA